MKNKAREMLVKEFEMLEKYTIIVTLIFLESWLVTLYFDAVQLF